MCSVLGFINSKRFQSKSLHGEVSYCQIIKSHIHEKESMVIPHQDANGVVKRSHGFGLILDIALLIARTREDIQLFWHGALAVQE